jgi:recombinational DNA repair ATPase RecF
MKIIPKIKNAVVKDKGIVKYALLNFKPGLNIITGKNGSGKTTVAEAISEKAEDFHDFFGCVPKGERFALLAAGFAALNDSRCIVLDDFDALDKDHARKLLNVLAKSKSQSIIVMRDVPKGIKANIISTEKFIHSLG